MIPRKQSSDTLIALVAIAAGYMLALFFGGCAPEEVSPPSITPPPTASDEPGELAELDEPPAAPLDVAGELVDPDCADDEPAQPREPDPIFALPAARCAGHWADNSDSSTRFVEHPDTGLCTFPCVWDEPKCHESWYGDPRCFPAHAAVLGQLCAELGGSCELDAARSNRYCVGAL